MGVGGLGCFLLSHTWRPFIPGVPHPLGLCLKVDSGPFRPQFSQAFQGFSSPPEGSALNQVPFPSLTHFTTTHWMFPLHPACSCHWLFGEQDRA